MISREVEAPLRRLLQGFPVVTMTGPRQSGKTTLAKAVFSEKPYLSLEDPDVRRMALDDARAFLGRLPDGAVLDEVQRAPELLCRVGVGEELPQPGGAGGIHFWRDSNGNEVDVIAEAGMKLMPIEIKSGQTLNQQFFAGLERWLALAGDRAAAPALVYGGSDNHRRVGINVFSWKATGKALRSSSASRH